MDSRRQRNVDILATGELLIDFISADFAENLDEATNFKRIPGGSPANLCMNMARLGNRASLAASVGNDDMGHYLFRYVQSHGVDVHQLYRVDSPTSLILVTRSQQVSNFEAYRGADSNITGDQFPESLLDDISIFHTTCFGLSREPARSAILTAAQKTSARGGQLSIDANYAAKIWPDRAEAQEILSSYVAMGAIVKISEIDWERLFDQPLSDPAVATRYFLEMGARAVCVTLGAEGSVVASAEEYHLLEAQTVEVKDTTGAGDAFWSGFLTAWLDGYELKACGHAGRRMAELKLGHFGPLPQRVERKLILGYE
ncbi:carbohydrate kinase family protein [Flavilitoribacter nigricans]|uniref:Carbohydrate kinase n=1 Tax=Flavilitoribacter nigricans (strain ATCC 23147 / DSM 23189 / NBRC 102662 / NCIMB 1420 / SS-2) TaxID=1122177 RepID=A0A2D0N5M5_FLAN2|nr:sugar kinase [Flavilitoribacter nigricans]PHN03811.1 carbohydrate kinase [Flavilitoribacter nigricans DSM 23189 = NBRC 102662]